MLFLRHNLKDKFSVKLFDKLHSVAEFIRRRGRKDTPFLDTGLCRLIYVTTLIGYDCVSIYDLREILYNCTEVLKEMSVLSPEESEFLYNLDIRLQDEYCGAENVDKTIEPRT